MYLKERYDKNKDEIILLLSLTKFCITWILHPEKPCDINVCAINHLISMFFLMIHKIIMHLTTEKVLRVNKMQQLISTYDLLRNWLFFDSIMFNIQPRLLLTSIPSFLLPFCPEHTLCFPLKAFFDLPQLYYIPHLVQCTIPYIQNYLYHTQVLSISISFLK